MGMVKQYQKVVAKAGVAGKLLSSVDCSSVVLNVAKVTLTATEIKALYTTEQTLVAAPGAGKFIQPVSITAALDYSGAVFTGTNALEFRENNKSGTKVTADITAAWLDSGSDVMCEVTGIEAQTARLLNKALVVNVPVANPGGGSATSTLTFTVHYRIVKPY